ncbi:hypothetical protein R3P38DRAFT_3237448 [Favolaschia claudopus]|uniref:F-box protein n=1 Tax=Favolaschia claudopus TaxID=2862362 RepID=A0AAV9ZBU3_9AGAR
MDMEHIKFVCERAGKSTRQTTFHISADPAAEPGADDMEGCEGMDALEEWARTVGALLSPVVVRARSIRVDCADPYGLFLLLSHMGAQNALGLSQLRCYSMIRRTDDFDYLGPIQSPRLQLLSVSRINPIGLAPTNSRPNLLHNVTVLRLCYVVPDLTWDQAILILSSCAALEELDVVAMPIVGDPGTTVLHLPHLRTLYMEISERGALQLAAIIRVPAIEYLTVRGESWDDWDRLVSECGEMLRKVKRCCICTYYYSLRIKDFIGELHSARVIDIRSGGARFTSSLTRSDGPGPPTLKHLKRWFVAADLSSPNADVLFDWPGSAVETIYAWTKEERDDRFMEWKQTGDGYKLTRISINIERLWE